MSAPFYSYDPCVCTGMPCGACYPYSTKPCAASMNDLGKCSVCPGGGCSYCPAPVRPCPAPCPAPPILPRLPPCPPCDKVIFQIYFDVSISNTETSSLIISLSNVSCFLYIRLHHLIFVPRKM